MTCTYRFNFWYNLPSRRKKFEQAITETRPVQYLYQMDDMAYFMGCHLSNMKSPAVIEQEQIILENSEAKTILREWSYCVTGSNDFGRAAAVTDTQPSISEQYSILVKPATLETGPVVNVPDFYRSHKIYHQYKNEPAFQHNLF